MDMKAGIGGIVAAGAALARCRERWAGRVLVSCVIDHMGDQIGAIRFFEEHAADYCILAELTDLYIYLGHRGRLYWDITAYGRSAHTCRRHTAVNAIARMVPLIEEIESLRLKPPVPDWIVELVGDELYTAVGRIYGGLPPGGPSMIPDECTIRVDSRPHPGLDETPVRVALEAAIAKVASQHPDARYEMVLADRKDSYLIEREHPLVQALTSRSGTSPATRRATRRARGWPTPPASASSSRRSSSAPATTRSTPPTSRWRSATSSAAPRSTPRRRCACSGSRNERPTRQARAPRTVAHVGTPNTG
jgi:acetylornithine deacetylase